MKIYNFVQGFVKYGSKLSILCFLYSGVAQSMACIRNYVNPLDHVVAGAVMGAVYRFNMGPKGNFISLIKSKKGFFD